MGWEICFQINTDDGPNPFTNSDLAFGQETTLLQSQLKFFIWAIQVLFGCHCTTLIFSHFILLPLFFATKVHWDRTNGIIAECLFTVFIVVWMLYCILLFHSVSLLRHVMWLVVQAASLWEQRLFWVTEHKIIRPLALQEQRWLLSEGDPHWFCLNNQGLLS